MYSEIVPQVGGETEFADIIRPMSGYLPAMKSRIEGQREIRNLDFSRTRRHGEDLLTAEQRAEVPPIAHPIVRTHPDTEQERYFLGDHAKSIEGMECEDGRALIEEINSMITSPARVYTHTWSPRQFMVCGQPLHAASRSRLRRGAIQTGDAPLHDQQQPAVLRPASSVTPVRGIDALSHLGRRHRDRRSICSPIRPAMDQTASVRSASGGNTGSIPVGRASCACA